LVFGGPSPTFLQGKIFDKIRNWRLTIPQMGKYGKSKTTGFITDYTHSKFCGGRLNNHGETFTQIGMGHGRPSRWALAHISSYYFFLYIFITYYFAFSALTLLAGRQLGVSKSIRPSKIE